MKKRVATVLAFVSALVVPALGNAATTPRLTTLLRPGELFFDISNLRQSAEHWSCRSAIAKLSPLEPPAVKVGWTHGDAPTGSTLSHRMGAYSSLMLKTSDAAVAAEAKAILLDWAKADALKTFRSNDSGSWWAAYTVMPPLLIAFEILTKDNAINEDEQKTIRDWFARVMKRTHIGKELPRGTAGYKDKEQRVNNHNARRNLLAMLWAIQNNDPKMFNAAVKNGYVRFLENIREDGSRYDANRGKWAMRYTAFHIGAALFMAEAAAHQGVDLYSLEVNGRSIHTAIRYLLDANDDEGLINKYAKQDIGMGGMPFEGKQDPSWKQRLGFETPIGWLEAYVKRFPDSENTPRLKALHNHYKAISNAKYLYDLSFGNVTCVYGGN